ncbi:hypothetical protein ABZW10_05370 [Kitasatospora sp. NPDC004723]|uniref:hypothetical protein n=1 Tax=Kitasatospora sp. NPDC004723 TaxID=3154288 RepID=UPI0033ADF8A9
MNELIVGTVGTILGALAGGGFTLAGARAQAIATHAQAGAARDIADRQADAAYLQWLRSSRTNAYTALMLDSMTAAKMMQAFRAERPLRTGLISGRSKRNVYDGRLRGLLADDFSSAVSRMRHARAVIELYGPAEVAKAAADLVDHCDSLQERVGFRWRLDPSRDHGLPAEAPQIRALRERFASVVQPHVSLTP